MARTNYPDYRSHQIYQDEWEHMGKTGKDSFSVWRIGGGLLAGAPKTIEEAHALVDASIAENEAFEASAEPFIVDDEEEIIRTVERLSR